MYIDMGNFANLDGPTGTLLKLAVSGLALLAILACTDSTDNSAPTPTPPSVVFGTPPAAMSTNAGDQPGSSIVVDLGQDPTPYPTSTPYPTATPYPEGAGGQTFGDEPSTQAGPSTGSAEGPGISIAIPKKTDLKHPNAGSALNGLVARVEAGEISAEEAAREAPLHQGESVGVIIHLSGNVDGVVAFLKWEGATNISAGEDYIEAFVPVLLLGAASEQQGVRRVRLIQPPESPQSGTGIEGNGSAVHGSTVWNLAGYSGQGIKIGVVDSGFSGLERLRGTEVPFTVQARCYNRGLVQHTQNLSDCAGGGTHGAIVAESVMDIAPEASLYISNPRSLSELRNAVDWMISEGVSVINHSKMWSFDGPGDGTSPLSISPLNTIDTAVAAGIVWVNAAGNQGQGAWFKHGPFSYSTVNVDGEDIRFINFDSSEFENRSHIGGRVELRWEDSWGRANRDLDLLLVNPDNSQDILYSIDPQTGEDGHNPYEWVSTGARYNVLVAHRGGSEPGWIQLLGWGWTQLEFNTSDTGSIVNPAESANPGMLAVGAAPWHNVGSIETFSSRGPTPDGRIKPDVVAADCGQTATDSGPFCGTSQASPHVAGMVALVRQRFPNYTPAQVTAYIKDNADQRISSPDPNNTWGHGFFVLPPLTQPLPSLPGAPAIASVTPGPGSLTVSWRAPVQTGGSAITAYDLRHIRGDATSKADGGWNLTRRIWAGSGPLSYAISGLDDGTGHDVQVRAVNSAGEGPWSATANGTPTRVPLSDDATLGGLRVSPVDITGFGRNVTTYTVEVENDISQVTVTATANHGRATIRISGNAVESGSALSVSLQEGQNVITITVTAEDGSTTKTYIVTVDRGSAVVGSTTPFSWKVTDDFELDLPSGFYPRGLWGSGSALWAACGTNNANIGAKLCAYNPAAKRQSNGYHTLATHGNNSPMGIWSDGVTMWVADANDKRIYAYKTASYFRDASKEFGNLTNAGNHAPAGIWSNGVVLYVADSSDAKLYAYFLSNQEWLSNPGHGFDSLRAAGNTNPSGIWSDGITMWVADRSDAKLYAYDMATKLRATGKDFDTLGSAGNRSPWGIWSDGVTMWVADSASNRVFSYNMPPESALGPLARPGAPRNLRAIPRDETSIGLSWSPPLNDGGIAITGYRIEVSQDGSNWRNYVANTRDASTSDGHNVLTPGSTYFYRVSARNPIGVGPASNIATATTHGEALSRPCATGGAVPDTSNNPGLVADCEALLAAKVVLAGTSGHNVNWSANTPIHSWQGVVVYGTPPRVKRVYSSNNGLNGTIPAELGSLSGLRELVLRDNDLTGEIPSELGNLANLTELKLDGNELSGAIPNELGNLANLRILWLSNNSLNGEIPPELGNLANLAILYLFNNQLGGDIPQELGKLTSLTTLWIGHRYVGDNQLTGCIPSSLNGQLTGSNTNLGGLEYCAAATFPGAPTGLTANGNGEAQIDLSWNPPSGDGGAPITGYRVEVSEDRSSWNDLAADTGSTSTNYSHTGLEAWTERHYRVSGINSAGTGPPSGIATGSTTGATPPNPCATEGAVPDAANNPGLVSDCDALLASRDTLRGTAALNWSAETSVGDWDGVTLNGAPQRVTRLDLDGSADLNGDRLTGIIPAELGSLTNLGSLSLGDNHLTGQIPREFGNFTALWQLHMPGNRLTGTIPEEMSRLTNLEWLTLSSNRFSGSIPAWLGNLSKLEGLYLTSNQFTGTIPVELDNLAKLQEIYLSDNRLTGCIPVGLQDVRSHDLAQLGLPDCGETTALGVPTGLTATADGQTKIDLSWNAPADDGGEDVTGYRIEVSEDRSSWSDLAADTGSTGTSYSHTGLTAGSTRYYRVSAINSAGTSSVSVIVTATTESARANAPGAPTGLTATADGQTKIDLSWNAPADDGGEDVTGYRIEVSEDRSSWSDLAADTGSTGTSYSHTGLTAGSTRYYRVSAINSAGTSSVSVIVTATTESARANAPGAPTGLTATADGQTKIDLSWNAPADDGGEDVTGYRIEVSEDRSSWSDLAADTGSTGTSYSHTGLTAGSTRYYRVSAINSAGTSSVSVIVTATTESARANAPGAPTGLTATADGQTKIDLSWNAPADDGGEDVTGYRIEVSEDRSSWSDLAADTGSTGTSYSHTGLTAGSTRYYRVSAINSAGTSSVSVIVTATTESARANAPGAPTGLTATADGQTKIDLSWNAPADDGGEDVTGYRIEVSEDRSSWSDLAADTGSTGTSYSHTGLTAGSTRYYRVSAINSAGTSSVSVIVTATTESARANAPGAPTGLTATADGQTKIDLSWNAPADDGGEDVTGYRIEVSEDRSSWSDLAADTGSTGTSYSHTGLTAGSTRYYRVSAINSAGTSSASVIVTATAESAEQTTADTCATGGAVSDADNNPGLVSDCDTLLGSKDTLRGTGTLNWSASTSISQWNGITVSGSPRRVTKLSITQGGLTGTIPAELGTLTSLQWLEFRDNDLTGTIPSKLGDLSNLEFLFLRNGQLTGAIPAELGSLGKLIHLDTRDNQLTGTIPGQLGNLTNLSDLKLHNNQLTGTIPAELGDLSNLTELFLHDNSLTGEIPEELANLSRLGQLFLRNNRLTGCIPAGLRDVRSHDLAQLGLPDCSEATEPGAPTGLTATADGQTKIDLSWNEPSDDGGEDVTGYRIEVSEDNSTWSDLVAATGSTGTSYSHTGMAAGSTRYYRVSAINSEGTGEASGVATASTDPARSPGTPTGLTATANGQTRIDLSWRVPSEDGGADITGYHIEVSPDGSSWSDLVANTSSATTSYSHTGLTAETTRRYRVSAINSAGTGTASNVANATTEAAPEPEESEAVTISLTSCSVDEHVGGNVYRFTLEGTVSAARAVSHVNLVAYVDGNPVGSKLIGDMEAGESEEFSISGPAAVDSDDPPCRVEVTWVE